MIRILQENCQLTFSERICHILVQFCIILFLTELNKSYRSPFQNENGGHL